MSFFEYLAWVKRLWSMCVEIVKLIEETIPDEGAGNAKLAAFDVMLKAAIEKADDIDIEFDRIRPVAHDIVTTIVGLFNTLGLFRKS